MNLVNDFEAIKACKKEFKWWPTWATKAMYGPVFVIDDDDLKDQYHPHDDLWRQLWDEDMTLRLPFPAFRIYCPKDRTGDEKGRKPAHWHLVSVTTGEIRLVTIQINMDDEGVHVAILRRIKMDKFQRMSKDEFIPEHIAEHNQDALSIDVVSPDGRRSLIEYYDAEHKMGVVGSSQDFMPDIIERAKTDQKWADKLGEFRTETNLFISFVVHFAYEMAYPSHHVVEVRPNKKGKSVEWVKARTHYVTMPSKAIQHSQRGGTRGEVQETIRRCAHDRRGHPRKLKADRFERDAQGGVRTIWIRDTWVGPKEWKSPDAVSIYKIIDFK